MICSYFFSGKGFIARKHMQRHEKTHVEFKPIACPLEGQCSFRTTRNDKLREHLRVHHPALAVEQGLMTAEAMHQKLARKVLRFDELGVCQAYDMETILRYII